MKNELKAASVDPPGRLRHSFVSILADQSVLAGTVVSAVLISLLCTGALADDDDRDSRDRRGNGNSAAKLRELIDQQVGGIDKLKVPARIEDIPLPKQPDGSVAYRYQTTEAKRFLGKMLFHDPVRSARVNINLGQPKNLPAGTAFGGTVSASISNLQEIVEAQRQDSSCGSCHLGEAAGKAGQRVNFASGGEGRGYTDENGNFFPRRRVQSFLTKLRNAPLYRGDVLVDALPTLTDIWSVDGKLNVTTPAFFYHYPDGKLEPEKAIADPRLQLIATGRLDQLDSVGRMSMSMVGFAFNNRLLFGGLGGEPQSTPGSLNPLSDPAQENLTLLLLDAHRMINFQAAELRRIPAFVKLFKDAFPEEAAKDTGNLETLINDDTEFRAQATFLRTVVTRNTPFDRFLAGEYPSLTSAQRRGARLFFTPAKEGGAGCFSCHSGPMLNKQANDPDVAGRGALVEQNFHNIGIGDHPVQALNALARNRLDLAKLGPDGFPYHAEDTGRQEITHNPNDAFKFRTLTLRQLKDGRNFFHNASFTNVRDVVEYFNAGIPQDATAGAAPTLSKQFTHPRGDGAPRGLGLSKQQVDDLTDFLENGLYDPAFVRFDPKSTTDTLQPNERDLMYSKYRPDLAALGAKDGLMPSGLAIASNDPLSRRDQGLEFLDITTQVQASLNDSDRHRGSRVQKDDYQFSNTTQSVVDTHLLVVVKGLSKQARLLNASGTTSNGDPYLRVFLPNGVLMPGQSIGRTLIFRRGSHNAPINYSLMLLSGQGTP